MLGNCKVMCTCCLMELEVLFGLEDGHVICPNCGAVSFTRKDKDGQELAEAV